MAIKRIIKKACKKAWPYLLGGLLFNQTFPGFCISMVPSVYSSGPRSITINELVFNRFQKLPQDYSVLDYLNLASSIVYNFSEGKGDCKDFTNSTYDACIALIEQNNREDLRNNLRMVAGYDRPFELAHQFIEYKNDGSETYTPFETRYYTPILSPFQIKRYSAQTQNMKSKGTKKIMSRSINGKRIFYPTLDAFLIPGGSIGIIYAAGSNLGKIRSSVTELSN